MTTQWIPDGPLDTPYRRARQEWDARMGSALVHARSWRLATFACMSALLLATGGMIYLGALPKAVPHIIEVDRLGAASYHGPVGQADYVPTDAVITYHLRRFIEDTREISSDFAVLQAQLARRVHAAHAARRAHALGLRAEAGERSVPAGAGRAGHRRDSSAPCARRAIPGRSIGASRPGTRTAASRALPSSGARCCARWSLTPKTAEAMRTNPIGLYIDELHWDRVGG